MSLNLRRVGEVADGSVTTAKLANGAVTAVKAANNLKTSYIVADDTEISYTGTVYSGSLKELRFVKKAADVPSGEIVVKTEIYSPSGQSDVGVFFNTEVTPRITLSQSAGTAYNLYEGTAYIGDISDGVVSVNVQLRNVDAATAWNRLLEIHGRA